MRDFLILIAATLFAAGATSTPAEAQWYKFGKKSESQLFEEAVSSNDLSLINSFVEKYPANAGLPELMVVKETVSYEQLVKSGDTATLKAFLAEFPQTSRRSSVEMLILKKEAIGRRVRTYRTVSFVVDSVNVFMGFGIERKAQYVIAIEGNVTDVTDNKKLKFTVDRVYVTDSSKNTYSKGQVGDIRYRPTAQKMAGKYMNAKEFTDASSAKYID